jgi:hypothetical protein
LSYGCLEKGATLKEKSFVESIEIFGIWKKLLEIGWAWWLAERGDSWHATGVFSPSDKFSFTK